MNLVKEVLQIAEAYGPGSDKTFYHVNSLMGAGRYVSDAKCIKSMMGQDNSVLDLGCGHGQMAYLMKRLNLNVTASDLMTETPYFISTYNKMYDDPSLQYYSWNILESKGQTGGKKFDAICISGVLEHTSNFDLFLTRLKSLLVSRGKLFIFRFPNRYSWIEKVNDYRFGGASDHPLRFSMREMNLMLRWHGFKIDRAEYEEILPVNVQNFSKVFVHAYHILNPMLIPISKTLCKIPVLNRLSTSFRMICTKAFD